MDEPWDTDPALPVPRGSACELDDAAPDQAQVPDQAEQGDLYGTAVRANAAARPLMLYGAKRAGLPSTPGCLAQRSRTSSQVLVSPWLL